MHQHILHTLLQGDTGRRATNATPRQLHRHHSRNFVKLNVADIPSIFLHRRSNPRFDQLLDHGYDFIIVIENGRIGNERCVQQHRLTGIEKVHQGAKNLGPHQLPLVFGVFRDGHKVVSQIDGFDAVDFKERRAEWGFQDVFHRIRFVDKVTRSVLVFENDPSGGDEFNGFGVGRAFGLNKYGSNLKIGVAVLLLGETSFRK
mmetsp:Transcript_27096/g.41650  ORF Transcript_27096/g.41650 Transcript_27096/m.41650 type:complete len:202 (-) Transcript_27096:229-834(-)